MKWFKQYISSSIGRKHLMAISGLALVGFLAGHLAGNLSMLASAEAFNRYSYMLLHTLKEFVLLLEIGLMLFFGVHVYFAIKLTKENRHASQGKYRVKAGAGGKTVASMTMIYSGLWAFAFILIHVMHFRFTFGIDKKFVTYNGLEMRDVYHTVITSFQSPLYTLFYVASMIIIGMHVSHGIQSAAQSLGANHPKFTGGIKRFSVAYAVVIHGGFIFLAIWAFLQRGGNY